jgi:acetylornithine/succinyldiaminopimelate/putrescine aminotransferase
VVAALEKERLVERVAERGPTLRDELEDAVGRLDLVREVRGRGFLLGIELRAPAAALVDEVTLEHGVLVLATHSDADGFTGDHVLVAPAYNASEAELAEMVGRIAAALADVQSRLA